MDGQSSSLVLTPCHVIFPDFQLYKMGTEYLLQGGSKITSVIIMRLATKSLNALHRLRSLLSPFHMLLHKDLQKHRKKCIITVPIFLMEKERLNNLP